MKFAIEVFNYLPEGYSITDASEEDMAFIASDMHKEFGTEGNITFLRYLKAREECYRQMIAGQGLRLVPTKTGYLLRYDDGRLAGRANNAKQIRQLLEALRYDV